MKRTQKSYGLFIAIAALLLGLACFGLFEVLGSSIAPDGRLQEPFALLPLGWACSGLMKPDTHLGENARQIEVSDDQTTPLLYC
jgi:hypothetical protein